MPDERTPELGRLPGDPGTVFLASIWGMSFPWRLTAATVLGLWVMFVPAVLGVEQPASHAHHLLGALIITVSVISMGEPVRIGRYLNVLLAAALIAGGWMLDGATGTSRANDLIVGLGVIGLSLTRGRITESFGTWDRCVR